MYSVFDLYIKSYIEKNKKVVLWGTGIISQNLLEKSSNLKKLISTVIDSNSDRQELNFFNFRIKSPISLKQSEVDIIIVASIAFVDDIIYDIINNYRIKATIISCKGIIQSNL
ncbi:hypothetical protein SDC9_161014 [bioreactor metagenome]|uniref:C-methyltransferase domain-containing protein n=1 Tax=bioreactor metagenome TaxID=1076179 RepID=A0A645FIA4_9ZZZZ